MKIKPLKNTNSWKIAGKDNGEKTFFYIFFWYINLSLCKYSSAIVFNKKKSYKFKNKEKHLLDV